MTGGGWTYNPDNYTDTGPVEPKKLPTSAYGVEDYNRNSSKYAQKTYADLTRASWEDYKKRFLPVQRDYLKAVSSGQMLDEQLSRISTNVNNSFASAADTRNVQMQRYGIQPTQAQTASQQRGDALAKSMANAQAMNSTRDNERDRMMAFMEGNQTRGVVLNNSQGGNG